MTKNLRQPRGFTLIEMLVVIGLIALLAGVVLIAINPARQFRQANDAKRHGDVNAILDAIGQHIADKKGKWTCAAGALPATAKNMSNAAGDYDIRTCLVPTYIPELPVDPKTGTSYDGTDYNTKYTVMEDATTHRVTIEAPDTEEETPDIKVTR